MELDVHANKGQGWDVGRMSKRRLKFVKGEGRGEKRRRMWVAKKRPRCRKDSHC